MFGWDRFHPSAEGYAVAAAALLPTVLSPRCTGEDTPAGADRRATGVRSLPQAAAEAARHAGTEVSGVAGRTAATAARPAAGRSCAAGPVLRRGAGPQPGAGRPTHPNVEELA